MDNMLRQQVLNEAIRIGDELLSQADREKNGMSWKTMGIDFNDNNRVIWRNSEVVYNGVSGIILFLLELYKTTEDEKYLHAAVEGMAWVEQYCQNNPTNYYAFYSGRMGVAYTMLKMAEVTKISAYLKKALKLAKPCSAFLRAPGTVNDLLNGTSGTILGLLHLHAATGEKWILKTVDSFTRDLIEKAHHGPVGLYWDRSHQNIRGLCGFSHGAAGIGFVFLELGHYFENKAFYWMAGQAFLYESHFYNEGNKNWPDFRKGIWTDEDYEKHEKAFLDGDIDFFTKPGDLNAWCHGAAGIGLSRLRAFELLKNPVYEHHARTAIEKTIMTDIEQENSHRSFTLCHGVGGNAELFLEAYRILKDGDYLSPAENIAMKAITAKRESGTYLSGFTQYSGTREDSSLFMGNAGIGYFYLRLLDPLKIPSILAPKIDSTTKPGINISDYPEIGISIVDLRKKVIEKNFKRTLFMAEKLFPEKADGFFKESESTEGAIEKKLFIGFIEQGISGLPQYEQKPLSDCFALELTKFGVAEAIKSDAMQYMKAEVTAKQARKLLEMNEKRFLNLQFIWAPDMKLHFTGWNWSPEYREQWIDNSNSEASMHPVLLRPHHFGVSEEHLTSFSYTVLAAFQNGNRVGSALQDIIDFFENVSLEQRNTIESAVIEQIKQFVMTGILIEENSSKEL